MLWFWALFLWQTTFELAKIDVEGLSRFKPDAVLRTLDLKTGTKAGKAEFESACQRLIQTGLFEGCNWKYQPTSATGVTLTLQVQEAPAPQTVRLNISGIDEKQLWDWLRENEPLVQAQMPASDNAIEFYTQAIRKFLKQEMVSSVHTNLQTKENVLVFRPANAPKLESLRFEGATVIDAGELAKAALTTAEGMPATEFDVRQALDLNVRPLYEKLGYLNVKFPTITMGGAMATVQVDEGRAYRIGNVTATGAEPKIVKGEIADWQAITSAFDAITAGLRNEGYLDAKYEIDRMLNDATGTVDIRAAYNRGTQYVFRALKIEGLTASQESAVRRLWMLAPGAPMNAGYVDEFIKSAFGKIGEEYSGVATQMDRVEDSAVDVVITFRRVDVQGYCTIPVEAQMAIETTYSDLRGHLSEYMDRVVDDRDVVVVRRRNGKNVAMIAEDEFRSLMETVHVMSSPKNAQRLLTAFHRAETGVTRPLGIDQLRADLGVDE